MINLNGSRTRPSNLSDFEGKISWHHSIPSILFSTLGRENQLQYRERVAQYHDRDTGCPLYSIYWF